MIGTGEPLAPAFAFFAQHGATMRADPDECPHETILSPDNKDRYANDIHRLVVSGFSHLARKRQQQWQPFEDSVHLAVPSHRIYVLFHRDVLDVFG
jgi:hypothetical protein